MHASVLLEKGDKEAVKLVKDWLHEPKSPIETTIRQYIFFIKILLNENTNQLKRMNKKNVAAYTLFIIFLFGTGNFLLICFMT